LRSPAAFQCLTSGRGVALAVRGAAPHGTCDRSQGLPALRDHPWDPQGFLLAAWSGQGRQPADGVDVAGLLGATARAGLRTETVDPRTPMPHHHLGLVGAGPRTIPAEGDTAKPGHQRCVALPAFVSHLPDVEGARWGCHRGPRRVEDFRQARAMVLRARLRQGQVHHPVPLPQPMDVLGQQGGLPQAPICRWVWRHAAVLRRREARCPGGRVAVAHGVRALRAEHLDGPLPPERTVDAAPVWGTAWFVLRLLGADLRAENACGGRARRGDEPLRLGKGERERVA